MNFNKVADEINANSTNTNILEITPDILMNSNTRNIQIGEIIYNIYNDSVISYGADGPYMVYRSDSKLWSYTTKINAYVKAYLKEQSTLCINAIIEEQELKGSLYWTKTDSVSNGKNLIDIIEKLIQPKNSSEIIVTFNEAIHLDNRNTMRRNIEFSTLPYLCPIAHGLVADFRTGHIRQRVKEDLFTYEHNLEFDASLISMIDDYISKHFMENHLPEDQREQTSCFGRFMAYALMGSKTEQKFAFCIGSGGNGKSTLIQFFANTFGEAFSIQEMNILVRPKPGAPTPEMSELRMVRCVSISETNENEEIDSSVFKSISGGDVKSIRALYKNQTKMKPIFTPIIWANTLPNLRYDEYAIERRVIIFNLSAIFVKKDKYRKLKYQQLGDDNIHKYICTQKWKNGLFSWLIKHGIQFHTRGLDEPKCIRENLETAIIDSDQVDSFTEFLKYTVPCIIGTSMDVIYVEYTKIYLETYSKWLIPPKKLTSGSLGSKLSKLLYQETKNTLSKHNGRTRHAIKIVRTINNTK